MLEYNRWKNSLEVQKENGKHHGEIQHKMTQRIQGLIVLPSMEAVDLWDTKYWNLCTLVFNWDSVDPEAPEETENYFKSVQKTIDEINILQASDHWVGLAFIPRVFIPTGEDASYLGDDGGAYGGWFAVDKVWARFRLMLNLGAMFRPTANVFNNINVRHQMDFGLGAVYEILPEFLFAKGEFSGSTQFANFFSDSLTTPVQFYGGIEVLLKQGFALSLGGSAGLTDSYGTPDWRAVFGATFIPGKSRLFGFKKNKVVAVHFPFNKSVLQLDSYRKIDRFVRNFKRASNKYHVELVGHTDGIGESGANKTLGMRRAQAVRDYLIKRGIEASQIQIHKPVNHQPSIGTDAPTNMSNRKVVMRLVRS